MKKNEKGISKELFFTKDRLIVFICNYVNCEVDSAEYNKIKEYVNDNFDVLRYSHSFVEDYYGR